MATEGDESTLSASLSSEIPIEKLRASMKSDFEADMQHLKTEMREWWAKIDAERLHREEEERAWREKMEAEMLLRKSEIKAWTDRIEALERGVSHVKQSGADLKKMIRDTKKEMMDLNRGVAEVRLANQQRFRIPELYETFSIFLALHGRHLASGPYEHPWITMSQQGRQRALRRRVLDGEPHPMFESYPGPSTGS
ncbi:hypothetical protein IAT38_000206 [Cryptococcus sp. DSM 104549]